MNILRLFQSIVLSAVLLFGIAVASYLGLMAYRADLAEQAWRYARILASDRPERHRLRIGDGVSIEDPGKLARQLAAIAKLDPFRVDLEVVATSGAADAFSKVARGELDVAFVQGGVRPSESPGSIEIDQAAALVTIPLHLLIAGPRYAGRLTALKGETVWFDAEGSGTRSLAVQVLDSIDKELVRCIKPDGRSLEELRECRAANELPKAIFLTANLPSRFAEELIVDYGYQLEPLTMARALALRHYGVQEAEFPEYTYGKRVGNSGLPIRTVGARILLVAGSDRTEQGGSKVRQKHRAIAGLLAAIYESDFARGANLPQLDEADMDRNPEFPIHGATRGFRNRHQSIFTGENIQSMESLANLGFGCLLLLFFPARLLGRALGRWRFDSLLRAADRLRRDIVRSAAAGRDRAGSPDDSAGLNARLQTLRRRVARDYATGRLRKREQYDRLSIYIENLGVELGETRVGCDGPAGTPIGAYRP